MKKSILIISIFLCPLISFSQKIVKMEVDAFTKDFIVETSWSKLVENGKMVSRIRARKINKSYRLDFKLIFGGGAFSIDKGGEILMILENGEIFKLTNSKYAISSIGGGAIGLVSSGVLGARVTCLVSKEELLKLSKFSVKKIRVYANDGYVETEIRERRAKKFSEMISLITSG